MGGRGDAWVPGVGWGSLVWDRDHGHPWGWVTAAMVCGKLGDTPELSLGPHHDALCHWDPQPGWWFGSPPAPPRC